MNIYYAGQSQFGNRGCEALVRSTSVMIKNALPDAQFLCPSVQADLDRAQWPQAHEVNLQFVPFRPFPTLIKWWARACRLSPLVEKFWMPAPALSPVEKQIIAEADAVIMTGGDNISLDYGVASLYAWSNSIEKSAALNKPTFLWAGSVGPFSSKPHVEKRMIQHLKTYSGITVRESASYEYLKKLGINNVALVADPAFTLTLEPFDTSELLFGDSDVLGFNLSPLVRGYRPNDESRKAFDRESIEFIKDVVRNTQLSVLLIPHVDPLDGSSVNSDHTYMKTLLAELGDVSSRVKLAPRTLNACQLKYLISKCRYFIGARTHATIAALSTGVPTISVAYSVKAKGINQDLFGHINYVLETPKVTQQTLKSALQLLVEQEAEIKAVLATKIPEFKSKALISAEQFIKTCASKR